jgi:cytochrome d ubiquinol oxidase subunit I
LGWFLFYFKLQSLRTQVSIWNEAYKFWVKIFALTFALGVVSGITMSFQFGTNWPGYMETVGNIAGPLLGYEVLTAFFLEATFLGVMLFGKNRVSPRVHLLACFLVAFGTTLSAFWIIALNSWMQTPQGETKKCRITTHVSRVSHFKLPVQYGLVCAVGKMSHKGQSLSA